MNLILKEAEYEDLPLMMSWRSNPLIYKGFYQQASPLYWDEHLAWFKSRNSDWRTFICFYDDRPIGVVTIGQLDHWSPEIGYYIGEVSLHGKGVGTEAVRLGIEWVRGLGLAHVTHIHTTIKDDNIGSIKIMKKLGFKKGMEARKGEHYWVRKLGKQS